MQADYTKKTQGLSERAKEYEAFQAKAIAFDELMSNPQFSKFTETLQAPQQQEVPLTGTDLIAQIQENPEILKDLIRQEAQRLYGPLADRYYGDLAAKEIDSLRSKYSDFTEYEDGIADILSKDQSGVLTAEQAYKMLAFDKAKQAGINEGVKSVEQRKLGAAPQASSAAVQPSQRVSSILEAFNRARASEN
jgi:hypothetical protein